MAASSYKLNTQGDCNREINTVLHISLTFLNDYSPRYSLTEIIEDQFCVYFLQQQLFFPAVEKQHACGIFDVTEGSLYPPPTVV